MCGSAIVIAADGQHRVVKLIEERHLVVVSHGLARGDIGDFLDDKAIAFDDDLVNIGQGLPCFGLSRVGPAEVADTRDVAVDIHTEVFRSLGHLVIDIVGNEVVNDGLASRKFKVLSVDHEETTT